MVCTATKAAVSVRKRDLPKLIERNPIASAFSTSSRLKSPSGPINTTASSPDCKHLSEGASLLRNNEL